MTQRHRRPRAEKHKYKVDYNTDVWTKATAAADGEPYLVESAAIVQEGVAGANADVTPTYPYPTARSMLCRSITFKTVFSSNAINVAAPVATTVCGYVGLAAVKLKGTAAETSARVEAALHVQRFNPQTMEVLRNGGAPDLTGSSSDGEGTYRLMKHKVIPWMYHVPNVVEMDVQNVRLNPGEAAAFVVYNASGAAHAFKSASALAGYSQLSVRFQVDIGAS